MCALLSLLLNGEVEIGSAEVERRVRCASLHLCPASLMPTRQPKGNDLADLSADDELSPGGDVRADGADGETSARSRRGRHGRCARRIS